MVNAPARCELFAGGSCALGLSSIAADRLVGFFGPLIKSWDCLGAAAVGHAAGLKTSDFLANDGLWLATLMSWRSLKSSRVSENGK